MMKATIMIRPLLILQFRKNITYPTDAKLHKKIVKKVLDLVKKLGLPMRQSYTFLLKEIYRGQRFWNHPKIERKPSGPTEAYAHSSEDWSGS